MPARNQLPVTCAQCGTGFTRKASDVLRGRRFCSRSCFLAANSRPWAKSLHERAYRSWHGMHDRCYNAQNKRYKHYGARGVRVCARWMTFANFLADMGDPPIGKTLDRIDVNGNYEPDNCRWADRYEQGQNKRNNNVIETPAGRMCIAKAARMYGLNRVTLSTRVRSGWDHIRAVTEPARERS